MPRQYRLDKLEMPDFEELEPKARRKIMRQAVKVAGLEARRRAPVSSWDHRDSKMGKKGKLKRSISWDVQDRGLTGRVRAKAPHAHLVHDGTRPHAIPAPKDPERRKRAFPLYAGGRPVRHPGARAQPFLREAGEAVQGEMVAIMEEGVMAAAEEAGLT